MSRVHDALRRAEKSGEPVAPVVQPKIETRSPAVTVEMGENLAGLLEMVEEVPFRTATDSLLIDAARPHEAPMEEFRTLRTRLNHMQSLQPIHTVVVTSASPAEGKSLTAANLALAESHLSGNTTLLADFDFRRPLIHTMFGIDRGPGITDYLMGQAPLHKVIKRIAGTNLYVMPAGQAVINPLELLNLREVKHLLDRLPSLFQWVIMDSPPLLFAADANLLGTLSDGTLLVVRIGHTTIDSVTRAMQSLCNNNVLGIVVNGARRGELYSKYTTITPITRPRKRTRKKARRLRRSSPASARTTSGRRSKGRSSRLQNQSRILAAESDAVGHRIFDPGAAAVFRNIVQIALRIRNFNVGGGRQNSIAHGQQSRRDPSRAAGSLRMPDQALERRAGQPVRMLAEGQLHRASLDTIVELGAGAMVVQIADRFGGHAGLFERQGDGARGFFAAFFQAHPVIRLAGGSVARDLA
jgi:receptor protein-tyrosine kinase